MQIRSRDLYRLKKLVLSRLSDTGLTQKESSVKGLSTTTPSAGIPIFRKQVRTHLESDLLTDAQQVEYLPKFVAGEALEVVKRNRGCTFNQIMKTLEKRFGQAVRVTQAFVEELASGPKLAYGRQYWSSQFLSYLTSTRNLNAATS